MTSEGSGESAHARSLASAFAVLDVDEGSCLTSMDISASNFNIGFKYGVCDKYRYRIGCVKIIVQGH